MADGMIFLPDETDAEWSGGIGLVSAPMEALQGMAASREAARLDETTWRGMVALCLLADIWPDGPEVTVKTITPDASAFAAAVLAEPVRLVLADGQLLGVADDGLGVIPAAQLKELTLPGCIAWYDGAFGDPVDKLNEHERHVLLRRLSALRQGDAMVHRLMGALNQAGMKTAQAIAHGDAVALHALTVRLKATQGGLPGVTEQRTLYQAEANPLLAALGLEERLDTGVCPMTAWQYQGVTFARTSSAIGLEGGCDPREGEALAAMEQEIILLEKYSPAWRKQLCQQLMRFEMQQNDNRALLPVVRQLVADLQREATVPVPKETLRLTWPWTADGVQKLLWQEALGDSLDAGLAAPFADQLCLMPGGAWNVLGDTVLSRLCVLPGDGMEPASAVIPPVSMALAACAGQQLVLESFHFQRTETGEIRASFALRGQDTVVLERIYQPEEIRRLSMEESPTVAVWPSIPLPAESWKAYYVYIHGGTVRASALQKGAWLPTEDRLFSILKTEVFPEMIALHEGKACLGVLPNTLPPCRPARTVQALAVLDIGASGVAMALKQGGDTELVRVPGLVRTLLRGAKAAPLSEEFLPAAPLGPILPSAAELFNDAPEPRPLVDGHILMPEDCSVLAKRNDADLHCAWKWSADASARRARRLMVHQAMLTASLAAVLKGAPAIAWRMTLPENMAASGRKELWQDVTELAPVMAAECGLPLADPQVAHADESMAMGAYLRGEGGIRGGFMVLDVGSCDVSLALWLRGMNRPAVRCSLPLGVQSMLLDGLMQAPSALEEDFADMADENARQAVMHLAAQLRKASSRKGMEKCRFLMDQCLTEHGAALTAHMTLRFNQGRTTLMQSLIFQAFAAMLALSGLVQEQVRRDPLLNDYLPAEMTYVLSGRGSQLMNAMPENLKSALAQFVRLEMSGDHPVRSLRFMPSASPKCEAVLGLARMTEMRTDAPAAAQSLRPSGQMHMPPDLLIMRFLSAFRSVFPQATQRIYGSVFDRTGLITGEAEGAIRAAVARHFAAASEPEAALAACLAELRDIPSE